MVSKAYMFLSHVDNEQQGYLQNSSNFFGNRCFFILLRSKCITVWGEGIQLQNSVAVYKLSCSLDMLPSGGSNMSYTCGSTDDVMLKVITKIYNN